jgi:hypothetical protein
LLSIGSVVFLGIESILENYSPISADVWGATTWDDDWILTLHDFPLGGWGEASNQGTLEPVMLDI